MKTIQEMLQELSQCIVTVSGEFRFRTNWNGGKVPQPEPEKPDLDTFDPNVPFCIENVGDVPASVQYNTKNTNIRISKDYKTWNDYTNGDSITLDPTDRVYIKSDYVKDTGSNPRFVFNGDGTRLRARGNIASLIYGTNDAYANKYASTEEYCYSHMFLNCKGLTQAPDLPATILAEQCYASMFYGCTSLTQAPELPATTLTIGCYSNMFRACTSLTQAPELPATTLTNYCYDSMFSDCTSLTQAPELPATTLAEECYYNMFIGCTSITIASRLPAMILARSCYDGMFYGCKSLVQAPELPATTLDFGCYSQMFSGCESLVKAPELPATTLATRCYLLMLNGCTKLNYVKCLATDTSADNCLYGWLSNVSAKGTFECDNKKYFTLDSTDGIPRGWTITEINPDVEKPDLDIFDPNVPFCIENVGDVPASIQYNTKNTNIKISKDYKTWSDYTSGDSIALDPTDRVYIKSDLVIDIFGDPRFKFNGNGIRLRARGNIASLIYGTDDAYVNKYTSVTKYCYNALFKHCKSLTQAPELPATILAEWCYYDMFRNCTSLTQAPELPATTLVEYCYYHMFYDCASLTQAPELPVTTLASGCYNAMFYGCTKLTKAPELPATTLANDCYKFMFSGCSNLTQAPELPATTLANSCYYSMFQYCKKLNYVKCLATDTSATDCTKNWLSNVSATGTFECDNKKYFTIDSPNGIPSGWTITEINPDPPTPPDPEKPDLDVFDPNVPFCIENVGDVPVEIGMYDVTSNIRNTCEISYNNKDWITYNLAVDPNPSDIKKIKLTNKGDRVYIKSNHFGTTMSPTPYTRIKVLNESDTTKIQARGNIASLNYALYDEYKTKYNSTENSCYLGLFMSCKSLIKAPDLVATTLSKSCYLDMFKGCTNLKYIKCLATDISASNCTFEWVWGVASKGNFYTPTSTNWTTGRDGIPQGWTRHDIT